MTSYPTGVNCGATCIAVFNQGQPISLTARPNAGSVFKGWSGPACQNQASTCMFELDANTSLVAQFGRTATGAPSPTHPAKATSTPLASSSPGTADSAVPGSSSPGPSALGIVIGVSPEPTPSVASLSGAAGPSTDLTPVAIAIVIAAILLGGGMAFLGVELRRRGRSKG